ncbi:PREDICTED: putative two-component response regulator ARR19 [Tarenaya hassleriana]|uniref:putative two-component response regulator ARR19 n=1 Tax=Tarenaya hassleriana TaxID=28532 RepID=UPI00053C7352|nr:PREDICTED: putative two-component response regulator ARR19 [Tarenaya hassleriana]
MDAEQALVLREPSATQVSDEFPATVRVLVVDSDLNSLLVMEKTMKQYSYQVTTRDNAEEALSYIRTSKDKLDMVIWDLHMPGTDGLEALTTTIASDMDLPLIITSRDLEKESVMKAVRKGACDYLLKPVSKETIAVIWQHIVRKKTKPGLVRTVPRKQTTDDDVDVEETSDDVDQ